MKLTDKALKEARLNVCKFKDSYFDKNSNFTKFAKALIEAKVMVDRYNDATEFFVLPVSCFCQYVDQFWIGDFMLWGANVIFSDKIEHDEVIALSPKFKGSSKGFISNYLLEDEVMDNIADTIYEMWEQKFRVFKSLFLRDLEKVGLPSKVIDTFYEKYGNVVNMHEALS